MSCGFYCGPDAHCRTCPGGSCICHLLTSQTPLLLPTRGSCSNCGAAVFYPVLFSVTIQRRRESSHFERAAILAILSPPLYGLRRTEWMKKCLKIFLIKNNSKWQPRTFCNPPFEVVKPLATPTLRTTDITYS